MKILRESGSIQKTIPKMPWTLFAAVLVLLLWIVAAASFLTDKEFPAAPHCSGGIVPTPELKAL